MSKIIIDYSPKRGTSRNVRALNRQSGEEPEVIEYLKTPPGKARLNELVAATGQGVLDILPNPLQGAFAKEDGEKVLDAKGNRVA